VINIQADEPFVKPGDIDAVAAALRGEPDSIWTAVSPLTDPGCLNREDVVKAAVAHDGRVLYFSRAPIPHVRGNGGLASIHRHHIGIYGYAVSTLRRVVGLPLSPLEKAESLEQLRALEAGIPIRAVLVAPGFGGIDTKEDLARAQRILATEELPGGGA
jgi:3-deoxy-manno-octulosonate cytidylyltransferase (CMP-KDO synthetase)